MEKRDEISPERSELEANLERLAQQCRELQELRIGMLGNSILAKTIQSNKLTIDIPALRKLCDQEIDDALTITEESSSKNVLKMIREEIGSLCLPFNASSVIEERNVSVDFLSHVRQMLSVMRASNDRRRHLISTKFHQVLHRTDEMERARPILDECLSILSNEASTLRRCEMNIDAVLAHHAEDNTAKKKPSSVPLAAVGAFSASVRYVQRHFVTTSFVSKKFSRFCTKLSWMPFSQRYALFKRAKEYISADPLPGGGVATGVPVMITSNERLKSSLEVYRREFKISTDVDVAEGQEFLYELLKLAPAVHRAQTLGNIYPVRGSSLKPSDLFTEEGKADSPERFVEKQITYLVPSDWIQPGELDLPNQPRELVWERLRLQQRPEVDHLLKVEISFLQEDDWSVAMKRIKELVANHSDRSYALLDVEAVSVNAVPSAKDSVESSKTPNLNSIISPKPEKAKSLKLPHDLLFSLYVTRLIKTRLLRLRILSHYNFFRSLHRMFAIDRTGYSFRARSDHLSMPTRDGVASGERPTQHFDNIHISDFATAGTAALGDGRVELRHDTYTIDSEGIIRVRDANGQLVMYDAAQRDYDALTEELLRIGTHYISTFAEHFVPDRAAVLQDLWDSEASLCEAKRAAIEPYLDAYFSCTDPVAMAKLADVIAVISMTRPVLDLEATYFVPSFASTIVNLSLMGSLARDISLYLIANERDYVARVLSSNPAQSDKSILPFSIADSSIPPYRPTPTSPPLSVFETFLSLPLLAELPGILNSIVSTAFDSSKLLSTLTLPNGFEGALRRAILEQAVVEWRVLNEEEMLNRSLIETTIPLSNVPVIDDPLSIEMVVRDAARLSTLEARPAPTQPQFAQRKGDVGGAATPVAADDLEGIFLTETFVLAHVRRQIVAALYETDVLLGVYRNQASLYSRDLSKLLLPPLLADGRGNRDDGSEATALGAEFVAKLAIGELDRSFLAHSLSTVGGLKAAMNADSRGDLCVALKVQLIEKNLFGSLITFHVALLDRVMQLVFHREETLEAGPLASRAFPSKGGPGDKTDRSSKISAELKQYQAEAVSRIADRFVVLTTLKLPRRSAALSEFEKVSKTLKQQGFGPSASKKLKEVKLELIHSYADGLLNDMAPYILKVAAMRISDDLRSTLMAMPKGPTPFNVRNDDDGIGDSYGEDDRALLDNRRSAVWTIFSSADVVIRLPHAENRLQEVVDTLQLIRDVVRLLRAHASSALGLTDLLHANSGMEVLQTQLMRMKSQVDSLPDFNEIQRYLSSTRQVLFLKHAAALHRMRDAFFADKNDVAALRCVRALTLLFRSPSLPCLISHLGLFVQQRSFQSMGPCSHSAGPWVLQDFDSSLLELQGGERNVLSAELSRLDDILEQLIIEKDIRITVQGSEAIAAQAKFLNSVEALERLRARLLSRLTKVELPLTSDAHNVWKRSWDARVLVKLLKARERIDKEMSEAEALALSTEDGARQRMRAANFRGKLKSEETVTQFLTSSAREEFCLLFLQQEAEGLTLRHSQLMADVDAAAADKANAADGWAAVVADFVSELKRAAISKGGLGGAMGTIEVSEEHFNDSIDALARNLRSWGSTRLEEELSALKLSIAELQHCLFVSERSSATANVARELEVKSMRRRIESAVSDRCYLLLFKLDSLNRKAAEAQKEAATVEETVREKVRREFEELVRDLTMQLTVIKSQFKEYKEGLQSDMKSGLGEIKKDAMMKMVQSSTAPNELKRMTLSMAAREEVMEEIRQENAELKRAILKLRTMNTVKSISLKGNFDKKMHRMDEERSNATRELYMSRDEVEQKLALFKSQLEETQAALSAAEIEREKLKKELELAQRNKQVLMQWKLAKTALLVELEAKVKQYERWQHVDVDKLMVELEKRESDVRLAVSQNPELARKHRELIESKSSKELSRLQRQLTIEQRLKQEAFRKLEEMRADVRWGEYYETANDPKSALNYWKKRS
jgi:hypothetical protein